MQSSMGGNKDRMKGRQQSSSIGQKFPGLKSDPYTHNMHNTSEISIHFIS